MPPPVTSAAEPLASRLFLGPALRAQSDSRLVKLVREGYEGAFEEIVRRYRKPLDRFAASFVGNRSEDVTQDAFSKALLALRGSENEIELRPWLYRIVRNTALNDIRDRPPTVEQLEETLAGSESAAVEAERREEMTELMTRLRALPEPQRAAIVMRELEGLSHDEIAAALGVSGGAARQAIYRARISLRNGLGLLVPLPILRMLFEHGAAADAATGAAAAAAGVAGSGAAAAGGGAALGGIGAGTALKAGLATVLVAGTVGAGVAIESERTGGGGGPEPAEAAVSAQASGGAQSGASAGGPRESSGSGSGTSGGPEAGDDRGGRGDDRDDDRGRGESEDRGGDSGLDDSDDRDDDDGRRGSHSGPGGGDDSGGHGGRGTSGHSAPDDDDDHSGSGSFSSGHPGDDDDSHSGGPGSGDEDSHSGPGSGDSGGSIVPPPPPPPEEVSGGDDESSGSGSGESDDDSSGSGSGGDD